MTSEEACKRLSDSPRTLERYVKDGLFKTVGAILTSNRGDKIGEKLKSRKNREGEAHEDSQALSPPDQPDLSS